MMVSYRPSQLAPAVLEAMQHWIFLQLRLPEEVNILGRYVEDRNAQAILCHLATLPIGQAYLCLRERTEHRYATQKMISFRAGPRSVPHVRHLNKYLRMPLPKAKQFYFYVSPGHSLGWSAANLWDFAEALRDLPLSSLEHHLQNGDFERWMAQVLHDHELARSISRVGRRQIHGEALRQTLQAVVTQRYAELDSLI